MAHELTLGGHSACVQIAVAAGHAAGRLLLVRDSKDTAGPGPRNHPGRADGVRPPDQAGR